MLDINPTQIHQRSPIFLGAKNDLKRILFSYKPLFSTYCFSSLIAAGSKKNVDELEAFLGDQDGAGESPTKKAKK